MKKQAQSGLAMVIVIWVLSLMTIMAGSFALTMRREITVISSVKDNAGALATAETGIAIAQQMLSINNKDMRWVADGSLYQIQYNDSEIRVRLLSEQGKIDINTAKEDLLTLMMESTSVEISEQQALVGAIIDWRDQDDLVHINGAEKREYDDAGLNYSPANKNFQMIEELLLVLGMNVSIFEELQPLITVYSEQDKVTLKVATDEVLVAVLEPDDYQAFIDNKNQQKENKKLNGSGFEPGQFESFGENDSASEGNNVYTIISQARENNGAEASIKITIRKISDGAHSIPYEVLDYKLQHQGISLFSDEMEQFLVITEDEPELKY